MSKQIIRLGNKVMVSDPCYGLGTWCQGVLENVLPGNYECNVEYSDEGDWGERVSAIEVTHEDSGIYRFEMADFEVGVDSGQAGIFDYEYYVQYHADQTVRPHVDDAWYDKVCDLTYTREKNPKYKPFNLNLDGLDADEMLAILREWEEWKTSDANQPYIERLTANTIDDRGFVSSSGYGDGGYSCLVARNRDGYIVAIRIEYITDDEEEDEWDDEDDYEEEE
jgi:hypothetical protein